MPLPVKRKLRQEAGFGCCKCGRPIIEYHHIIPYSNDDPHFRVEDMMCLCQGSFGIMVLEFNYLKKNSR